MLGRQEAPAKSAEASYKFWEALHTFSNRLLEAGKFPSVRPSTVDIRDVCFPSKATCCGVYPNVRSWPQGDIRTILLG